MKQSYLDTVKHCYGKTFRRRFGIRRRTFRQIYKCVRAYEAEQRAQQPLSRRGKKSTTLTLVEKLLFTFVYVRQYPTFEE